MTIVKNRLMSSPSRLPPVGHEALSAKQHQLLPQQLAHGPGVRRLHGLLQGHLLQSRSREAAGQCAQAEARRVGRGEGGHAGLLQP